VAKHKGRLKHPALKKQYVSPKHWYLPTSSHGVINHKTGSDIANTACLHINALLLLRSRLKDSMETFLHQLMVIVNINYPIPGKGYLVCKKHSKNKERVNHIFLQNKQ
jgi:hypothetical protein